MNKSLGMLLRETREAFGYTLDDVARETKIQKRYLIDLEEENFEDMPGRVYEKGFLKTYAVLLDLDIEMVTKLYEASRDGKDTDEGSEEELSSDPEKKKFKKLSILAFSVIILILIIIFSVSKLLSLDKERDIDLYSSLELVEDLEILEDSRDEYAYQLVEESQVETEEELLVIAFEEEFLETLIEDKKKELILKINGKSWLEVEKNGKNIIRKLANLEEIKIEGEIHDKIWIKIGDSSKVEIVYNGENLGILGREGQVIRKTF